MNWYWLVAAGLGGVIAGAIGCWLRIGSNVQMFRLLWENEKAGNFAMTQRLTKLEEEREDL